LCVTGTLHSNTVGVCGITPHERGITVRALEYIVTNLVMGKTLLLSVVSTIYSTLTTTAKAKIPVAEKAIIDHAVTNWTTTSTRGDRQLKAEGLKLIDKLHTREVAIVDIVDKYNK